MKAKFPEYNEGELSKFRSSSGPSYKIFIR